MTTSRHGETALRKEKRKMVLNGSSEHRKGMHEQFSQIFSTIKKSEIPRVSTRDPAFPALLQTTPTNHAVGATKKKDPRVQNQALCRLKKPHGHPFSINPPSHRICLSPPD
ncbi:hypothetical protein Tco_0647708 [Tanacetum coccineum]